MKVKQTEVIREMKHKDSMATPHARENGLRAVRGLMITALILSLSLVALVNIGPTHVEALDPHVVTGTVYEANGTACVNCTVVVLNVRTGETNTTSANATGIYAYNLLNLPSGWSYGDQIQITATNSTGVNGTNSTSLTIGTLSTTIDVWIGTITAVSGVNFYIVDEDGYPVDSALINIKDSSGDIVITLMTDSGGKTSTTLSDGLYTITVTKSGYDDIVKTIRVHGCDYAIRLLGVEVVGVTLAGLWFWILVLLAIIGTVVILAWILKKA